MNSLKSLSDRELTGRLQQLVREERNLTLSILLHIAEVGRRELYLESLLSASKPVRSINVEYYLLWRNCDTLLTWGRAAGSN